MTKDEALKQALELVQRFIECDGISSSDYLDVRDAIKKALAQPEKDLWANATIDERWYITREKEQKPMRPEIRKMWEEYFDKCFAAFADDYEKFMAQPDEFKCPLCYDDIANIKGKPLTDELYNELLFAVGNKYPNETRHQTALRYIQQAEMKSNQPAKAAHGIKE